MIVKSNFSDIAIVIPIYKESLSVFEKQSLMSCMNLLSGHDIIFAYPENLNLSKYQELTKDFNAQYFFFHKDYFQDIQGYNNLLTSTIYYNTFIKYEYILIFQLDCFIFRDELSDWCKKGYDYIGAPWIDQNVYNWLYYKDHPRELILVHKYLLRGKFLSKVGNGGLSLRKVESMMKNISRFSSAVSRWQANEDSFFCHYVKTFNPFFKIPSFNEALQFAFDALPEKCFNLNKKKLPFGCHAWYRNDKTYGDNLTFWSNYINVEK